MTRLLSVIVSTTAASVRKRLPHQLMNIAQHPRVELGFVLQRGVNPAEGDSVPDFLRLANDNGIPVYIFDELGLSRSRNRAIDVAEGRYIYLCDDDVELDVDALLSIAERAESQSLSIAAFRVRQGSGDYKSYPLRERRIGLLGAASLHSANFIIQRSMLREAKVRYPEDMGLGTELPTGEEYVFVAALLRHGAEARYFPIVAVHHPDVSSGQSFPRDVRDVRAKRVMLDRVFGHLSVLFRLAFALRKARMAAKRMTLRQFFGEMLWGARQ